MKICTRMFKKFDLRVLITFANSVFNGVKEKDIYIDRIPYDIKQKEIGGCFLTFQGASSTPSSRVKE